MVDHIRGGWYFSCFKVKGITTSYLSWSLLDCLLLMGERRSGERLWLEP